MRAITSVLPPCPSCAANAIGINRAARLRSMKKIHKPFNMQFFIPITYGNVIMVTLHCYQTFSIALKNTM